MAKEERHKIIRERNLEQQIRELFAKGVPMTAVAEQLDLPHSAVVRFLREESIKNYDDTKLAKIAKVEDYNPLSLIDTFFDAASFVASDLRFTAILAAKFREEIADKMNQSDGSMQAFTDETNKKLFEAWYMNTEKLMKLSDRSEKQLQTFINLLTQVLDISREISYVRVVTEVLQDSDPATYKKIQKALREDPAAKAVMGALDTSAIVDFWVNDGTPAKAKQELENGIKDDTREE